MADGADTSWCPQSWKHRSMYFKQQATGFTLSSRIPRLREKQTLQSHMGLFLSVRTQIITLWVQAHRLVTLSDPKSSMVYTSLKRYAECSQDLGAMQELTVLSVLIKTTQSLEN